MAVYVAAVRPEYSLGLAHELCPMACLRHRSAPSDVGANFFVRRKELRRLGIAWFEHCLG